MCLQCRICHVAAWSTTTNVWIKWFNEIRHRHLSFGPATNRSWPWENVDRAPITRTIRRMKPICHNLAISRSLRRHRHHGFAEYSPPSSHFSRQFTPEPLASSGANKAKATTTHATPLKRNKVFVEKWAISRLRCTHINCKCTRTQIYLRSFTQAFSNASANLSTTDLQLSSDTFTWQFQRFCFLIPGFCDHRTGLVARKRDSSSVCWSYCRCCSLVVSHSVHFKIKHTHTHIINSINSQFSRIYHSSFTYYLFLFNFLSFIQFCRYILLSR